MLGFDSCYQWQLGRTRGEFLNSNCIAQNNTCDQLLLLEF